jgi:hypothetical protein
MQQVAEALQDEFAEAFESFNGDTAVFESSREKLTDCMQEQYRVEKKKKSPWALLLVILFFLTFLGWFGYASFVSWHQDKYIAMIKNEPGYVITDASVESGVLLIRGLRDSLSRPPETLLAGSGLKMASVSHQFEAYQSLNSSFVRARLHKWLEPPDTVSLDLIDDLLVM